MYTQLHIYSLAAKKVAAVDSCFTLVRVRQHCIARHRTRHKVFLPVPFTSKVGPQLWVSLNLSHQTTSVGPLLTWQWHKLVSLDSVLQGNSVQQKKCHVKHCSKGPTLVVW